MNESAFKYFEDLTEMASTKEMKKDFTVDDNSIENGNVILLCFSDYDSIPYKSHSIKFFYYDYEEQAHEVLRPAIYFKENKIYAVFLDKRNDSIIREECIEDSSDWFNVCTEAEGIGIAFDDIIRIRDIITKSEVFFEIRYSFDEELGYGY